MLRKKEHVGEILLQVHDDDDGNESKVVLQQLSSLEKENFNCFKALKDVSAHQSSKLKPLIQRVPSTFSENSDFNKYIQPRVVAIGPLHHGNSKLYRAEETKLKLAVEFTNEHGVSEQVLYNNIKKEIVDLKRCYSHEDVEKFEDDELAWMLFVDGCAVLQAITKKDKDKRSMVNNIKVDCLAFAQLDLFMSENQLPFQVLHILMSSVNKEKKIKEAINEFIEDQIKKIIPIGTPKGKDKQPPPPQDDDIDTNQLPHHLLGLLRKRLLANPKGNYSSPSSLVGEMIQALGWRVSHKTFHSIHELNEAGIRVIPSKTRSLLDVAFHFRLLGTLKIPGIVVDDSTASKFINLVAYEMCPDFDNDFGISSYMCFLDILIDTSIDVKELRHAGVLLNQMGSDEDVANFFNKVTTNLIPNLGGYRQVMLKIAKYYDNWWRPNLAKAYYTRFSNPWSIIVFLWGLIGFVLAIFQLIYLKKRKSDD